MDKIGLSHRARHVIWALCVGIMITCVFSVSADKTEQSIASGIIRLHVIANSDSDEDQELKLKVRDAVVDRVGHLFADSGDKSAARGEILANMHVIEAVAGEVLADNGYSYGVNVELGMSDFPTRVYDGVTLPAGTYEALKITLGEGAGRNWWCVLFPPLCFVDEATSVVSDSEQLLKATLGEDEYAMVTRSDEFPVNVKFKAYEIWQNGKIIMKNMIARR